MMTTVIASSLDQSKIDDLHHELLLDFVQGCTAFAEARRQQRVKDTSARRAAVQECRARIDAVLDMYLLYLEIERHGIDQVRTAARATHGLPDAA